MSNMLMLESVLMQTLSHRFAFKIVVPRDKRDAVFFRLT